MVQRVVKYFEGSLRDQGLTPVRRRQIQAWEARVHWSGAAVADIADLEKRLQEAIAREIYEKQKISIYRQWCQRYSRAHLPQRPRLGSGPPLSTGMSRLDVRGRGVNGRLAGRLPRATRWRPGCWGVKGGS